MNKLLGKNITTNSSHISLVSEICNFFFPDSAKYLLCMAASYHLFQCTTKLVLFTLRDNLSFKMPAGRHFSAVSWAWSGTFKITCIAGRHNKVIFDNICPKIKAFDFASKEHDNSRTLKFYDSNIVSIT